MQDFLLHHYLWLKAFHIISIVAWMAGMLYLPRLFVYHAEAPQGSGKAETFITMEEKLLRVIMNPAMIAAWLFGILMLAANPGLFTQGWMHVKISCVIAMTILHMVFARWRKNLARGENKHTAKFYRYWNEVPALLLIVIVIMAVAEPF